MGLAPPSLVPTDRVPVRKMSVINSQSPVGPLQNSESFTHSVRMRDRVCAYGGRRQRPNVAVSYRVLS